MPYEMLSAYHVIIKTPRFILTPMTSADTPALLALCAKDGFSYPFIHANQKTKDQLLPDRVATYTALADDCLAGKEGKSLILSIRGHGDEQLLGAAILYATTQDSTLFDIRNPDLEKEIGYFVDVDHQDKGIATEAIRHTILFGMEKWHTQMLHASIEPSRKASIAIARKLGLELVTQIAPGSKYVPYNDDNGNPAARNIYATSPVWQNGFSII